MRRSQKGERIRREPEKREQHMKYCRSSRAREG